MTKTNAYKDGLQSALEDWSLTGTPHRTRKIPPKYLDKRTEWFMGRCHGFQEADRLIHEKKMKKDVDVSD